MEESEKKARRSSILKPQKPRTPLTELDFSEANPDNTIARATRRVSFASSNFIKPFAADSEKNTIWDTTYEEALNHTDSTKSSCDQTQATKTNDFLNVSSVNAATSQLCQSDRVFSPCFSTEHVNTNTRKVEVVTDILNPAESLVSIARKLRNKITGRSTNEAMNFTLINESNKEKNVTVGNEIYHPISVFESGKNTSSATYTAMDMTCDKENISTIPIFNSGKSSCVSTTKLVNTAMEMTCIDKENVNPIINDLSLVIPRVNCATNKTKYFVEEDLDLTKPLCSETVMELTGIGENLLADNRGKYCEDSVINMELTNVEKHDKIHQHLVETTLSRTRRKTILFNETEGNMEFTVTNSEESIMDEQNKKGVSDQSNDMEFTSALPVNIQDNIKDTNRVENITSKRETICCNESTEDIAGGHRKIINTLPVSVQDSIKDTNQVQKSDSRRGTIYSNESMEFTNAYVIQKAHTENIAGGHRKTTTLPLNYQDIMEIKPVEKPPSRSETIYSNESMQFTNTYAIQEPPTEHIAGCHQKAINTLRVGVQDNIKDTNQVQKPACRRETIYSNESMQFTNTYAIQEAPTEHIAGCHRKTTTLPLNVQDKIMNTNPVEKPQCRRETIYSNESMQFTNTYAIQEAPAEHIAEGHTKSTILPLNVQDNIVNTNRVEKPSSRRETIYCNESMQFTNAYAIQEAPTEDIARSHRKRTTLPLKIQNDMEPNPVEKPQCRRETIYSNESMQFTNTYAMQEAPTEHIAGGHRITTTLPLNVQENIMNTNPVKKPPCRRETIYSNESMQFTNTYAIQEAPTQHIVAGHKKTTAVPLNIQDNIKDTNPVEHSTSRRDKIYCDESMEFTNTYAVDKTPRGDAEGDSQKLKYLNKTEYMECSTILPGNIDECIISKNITEFDNMEAIRVLTGETEELMKDRTRFECDMELTSAEPLQTKNIQVEQLSSSKQQNVVLKNYSQIVNVESKSGSSNEIHNEYNVLDTNVVNSKKSFGSVKMCSENRGAIKKMKTGVPLPPENSIVDLQYKRLDSVTDGQNVQLTSETNLTEALPNSKPNLQTSTLSNSNILYSEPMKIKLKDSSFTPVPELNLDESLNLDNISTPLMSFHMNLSAMSSCIEDTQQLIHATFSKPETLKILTRGKDTDQSFNVSDRIDVPTKLDRDSIPKEISDLKNNEKITLLQQTDEHSVIQPELDPFIKISNKNSASDKSCFIEDTTPLELVLEESNNSNSEIKTVDSPQNNSNSDLNYTLRAQMILSHIDKYLIPYKPKKYKRDNYWIEKFKENSRLIQERLSKPLKKLPSLEEMHKQDMMEESSSGTNEMVVSSEEDSSAPSTLELLAPKTLQERICEAGKRAKKYWEFVKVDGDWYCFYTLFQTLAFKVHIHPELGIVYNIETLPNLSEFSPPMCFYQLKLLQHKFNQENLFSVLGAKFDIFALLDYVYMSMEEMIKFHLEYDSLVEKYGDSHHFKMNPDYSVKFEILSVKWVLFWIITIKMPITNPYSIRKEDVTAINKVGEKVNEELIKKIAENTLKGPNFLRNFIESVDEYVKRKYEKKLRKY